MTSQMTTDHETIKQWAKQRGGKPAEVKGVEGEHPGLLRIEFPDYDQDQDLKRIQWPSFFKKFDEQNLAMLYQDRTRRGEVSRFNKLVYAPEGVLHQLHQEHERVRKLLADMSDTTTNAKKTRPKLLGQLRELLIPHMAGEEKVVYKALKKAAEADEAMTTVLEGYEEHKLAKKALSRLEKADPESPEWDARCNVLKEVIDHHTEEEESEMFDLARNLLGRDGLDEIEDDYEQRKAKALGKLS